MKKKTRRGRAKRNALQNCKIMLNNVRGYKTKQMVIKRIIEEEKPTMIAFTETKLNKKDEVKIDGYLIKRVDRDEDGGGVMLAYKPVMKNIMICTAEIKLHNAEILWYKIDNGRAKVNLGVVYMPQESRTKLDKLKEIYKKIEEQVKQAREKNESILIMGDLNCKIGKEIKDNKEEISKGGKLLINIMKKHRMKAVNAEKCNGLWTRIEGDQKSVLDYVIVFEEDLEKVKSMDIDNEKDITPYYIEKDENNRKVRKYSDHLMITVHMQMVLKLKEETKYAIVMDNEGMKKFADELKKK